jgi:glycerol dehydrogenase-like iron-containing ADH family enzyme
MQLLNTIYGRNLVYELTQVIPRPFLVATMADLWPRFEAQLGGRDTHLYVVDSMELAGLDQALTTLPEVRAVVGLGGGRAVDAAKVFAWRRGLPLWQVPTSTSVNAPFGHRAGVRVNGQVKYIGWAVPEGVYIDYDVIGTAPPLVNRSGICEILCYHTAHLDWAFARDRGKCEDKWPYDQGQVDEARAVMDRLMAALPDVHAVNDAGIHALCEANRWGGASFHHFGWNPRPIEGFDHFLFYGLEHRVRRPFLHGQPVCLGIYLGSLAHGVGAESMLDAITGCEVDIRPEAMGVAWDDVEAVLRGLPEFVREAGLWYGLAHELRIDDGFVPTARAAIEARLGAWAA